MPKRDDDILISDMVECCEKIFVNDSKAIDAVIRNFEVFEEASRFVSTELKLNSPLIE